jgi:hypothetical protein
MSSDQPSPRVQRIVSGGQTGVDRAALDAAIALDIDHGGWCPRGRLAEDGRIAARYRLQETSSSDYWVRTEQNVIDSDGTLILYRGQLSGGTQLTLRMAAKHRKACLLIDLAGDRDIDGVRQWLVSNAVQVLNVAGPRESSVPGITKEAFEFLQTVLIDT